jgi:glycosyltransferase involved in cell wall biosynthesis
MAAVVQLDSVTTDSDVAPPGLTVVVCTRDRPSLLAGCLASLRSLDPAPEEVLVVDNGSTGPETAEVVAQAEFRFVREEDEGLNRARNLGWRSSMHDVVAYVDDDVRVQGDWAAAIQQAFRDPTLAAVTGLVEPVALETHAQRLFQHYGGGMSRGERARDFHRDAMSWRELIEVQRAGVGANMAIRRSVLAALGGFDPALDLGTPAHGAGDLDLFHRLLVHGWRLRYEPAARVLHHDREDLPALQRQLYDNGRAFGVYLLKIWRERTVPRSALIRYAGRRAAWLVGRVGKRLVRANALPMPLLLAELRGTFDAPAAYRATYGGGGRGTS